MLAVVSVIMKCHFLSKQKYVVDTDKENERVKNRTMSNSILCFSSFAKYIGNFTSLVPLHKITFRNS